jgi:hypothetical protein
MSKEWNGSAIMANFAKIASDSNLTKEALLGATFEPKDREQYVGNSKTPTPVKDHRRYEPTEDYDVTEGEGKDLIEKAHPESPAQVADAMGKGALVENQVEQQEAILERALKMPQATLPGLHANIIHSLIKLANQLDEMGNHKEAIAVDKTLSKVLGVPFDNGHLRREAWFIPALIAMVAPFAINKLFAPKVSVPGTWGGTQRAPMKWKGSLLGKAGWLTSIIGALAAFGDKVISMQDNLTTDLKEFHDELIRTKSANIAQSIALKLEPFKSSFDNIDLSKRAGVAEYTKKISALKTILPQIKREMSALKQELGGKWYDIFKTPIKKLKIMEPEYVDLKARYDDFVSSFNKAYQGLTSLYHAGQKVDAKVQIAPAPTIAAGLKGVQTVLSQVGFKGKKWPDVKPTGKPDDATKRAASELEDLLDKSLKSAFKGTKFEKTSMKGRVLSSTDPNYGQKLYNLIKEVEAKIT